MQLVQKSSQRGGVCEIGRLHTAIAQNACLETKHQHHIAGLHSTAGKCEYASWNLDAGCLGEIGRAVERDLVGRVRKRKVVQ
jgi:hypothetical protein